MQQINEELWDVLVPSQQCSNTARAMLALPWKRSTDFKSCAKAHEWSGEQLAASKRGESTTKGEWIRPVRAGASA